VQNSAVFLGFLVASSDGFVPVDCTARNIPGNLLDAPSKPLRHLDDRPQGSGFVLMSVQIEQHCARQA